MKLFDSLQVRMGVLLLSLVLGAATSPCTAQETLQFGVVPQFDARRIQSIWQPILDAVGEQAGVHFELSASPSIPKFEQQFTRGDFDFAYMNPYHLLMAHESQGYYPVVRDVGRKLFGIVVVRKDSPLQRVEDLDGKSIAFPAPNALGASLIPRTEFRETFKIDFEPRYVRSHSSVYLNVLTGQTAAGGGVQKTLQQQAPNIRDQLRIIYRTPEVAPHPVAVHPRVPETVRDKVRDAFLQLGETPAGRELLSGIPIKLIGQAELQDYRALQQMGLEKYYVH